MRAALRGPAQEAGAQGRRELTPERSAQLAAVKLRGLVSEHLGQTVAEASPLGSGAVLEVGPAGWMYLPDARPGALGVAAVWARRHGLGSIGLIVDVDSGAPATGAGALAFAAAGFQDPELVVWRAEGRTIHPVAEVVPEIPEPPPCPDQVALLAAAGLDVVADHAVWLGEVNGLEVARVGDRGDGCGIDIGVGAYDQFAAAAINRDRGDREALDDVAVLVRAHRSAGSAPHAIGRLVRSRWLRAQACREPSAVGLDELRPVPLVVPRPGLNEAQPAAGLGRRGDSTVLAVCSVGLDVGLAETAAALLRYHEPDDVIAVLPARDRHPRIEQMLAGLAVPARVVELDGAWAD